MLERHRILHELGRGASGAVYAARDRTTGALVALKRLDPASLKSDAGLAGRFVRQARAVQRLRHANIVAIHDAGEAAGTAYVAMEMLEGESLRKVLDEGPLPIARAIQVAREVASGLAHAHLEGVIHGALKPSNVIVLRSGGVKITDFGIGQPAPGYLSPEQARGAPIDHRCDVFSLGALFYEMLTQRPPVPNARPAPPSELNLHVPRALDAIVLSMLVAEPAARMPGVPVLLRELERLEEGLGLGSGASAGTTAAPAPGVPPAAPEPEPEPVLRTPAPDRSEHRAPSPADAFQHRQITQREILEYERAMRAARESPPPRSSSGPAILAALVLLLAVLGFGFAEFMGVTGFVDDWASRGKQDATASRLREATPAPVAQVSSEPARPPDADPVTPPTTPVASAPNTAPPPAPTEAPRQPAIPSVRDLMPEKPIPAEPDPLADTEPETEPEPAPAATPKQIPRAEQRAPKQQAQQPGRTARLVLLVSPRGELYINGEHRGTTPPMTTFDLEPGMHRVEVRNGSRRPYLTYMTLEPGDVRRIRHDFDAKRGGPPR